MDTNFIKWFEEWAESFPLPGIITDNELKVLRSNEKAKKLCNNKLDYHVYLEQWFDPSLLSLFLNFKTNLIKHQFAEAELMIRDIGSSKLIGQQYQYESAIYIILIVPLYYKDRFLALNSKYQAIFEHMKESVIITDEKYKIIDSNPAFSRMSGYKFEEVKGRLPSILSSGKQDDAFYNNMYNNLKQKGIYTSELVDRKQNGELLHIQSTILSYTDPIENADGYIAIMEDIGELKTLKNKVHSITFKDTLTGINNRESLLSVLDIKMELSNHENQLALLFVDLNKFKLVNDTYGHQQGDAVLVEAARRMKSILRANDLIGRYGGDEFLIVLERITDETAYAIAKKLNEILSRPYEIHGKTINFISGSIGIAMSPLDALSTTVLIEKADSAMYEAKKLHLTDHIGFAKDILSNSGDEKTIRSELLSAINHDEFYIRIQPIISLKTNKIVGGEVLARWLNLYFDQVSPGIFFPLASKMGMTSRLDEHIMKLAIEELVANRFNGSYFITINITADRFNESTFLSSLEEIMRRFPFFKNYLVLEMTESSMMQNIDTAISTLEKIREIGFGIAIDDFGTGFSSLSYLKHFPVDFLKIDISFIRQIDTDEKDRDIVRTIITLANAIGAKTIVEGVERPEQYEIVQEMGIDYAQGFYLDRPLYSKQFFEKVQYLSLA